MQQAGTKFVLTDYFLKKHKFCFNRNALAQITSPDFYFLVEFSEFHLSRKARKPESYFFLQEKSDQRKLLLLLRKKAFWLVPKLRDVAESWIGFKKNLKKMCTFANQILKYDYPENQRRN